MLLSDRVFRDYSYGGMIAYVGEWHEEVPGLWGIKWKNSRDKYTRSVECGYDLMLCDYIMSMLWKNYIEGNKLEKKAVWFMTF